jgi:hypothetical protein
MKVIDVLEKDASRVFAWIESKEPQFVSDIQAAYKFTQAALKWAQSPQGVTIEDFINANAKDAPKWESTATNIATSMLADMAAVKNVASLRGIALRLLAELLNLFDGGKLPTGIDGYLAEAQEVFIG